MARTVEEELEYYRAVFCTNCPYTPDCRNCVESGHRPTRVKALKRAIALDIPEKYARLVVVGGKNINLG